MTTLHWKTNVLYKKNQKAHTCARSNESDMLVSTLPEEARSLISSAKDRGVMSSRASPIASFRKALKTNSRHNARYECKQVIHWMSPFHCDGYNEASSCLSSNCCLSSWFVSLRSCSRNLFYMINNNLKFTLLVRKLMCKHQASWASPLWGWNTPRSFPLRASTAGFSVPNTCKNKFKQ